MHLSTTQLRDFVVTVMRQHFGNELVDRHHAIDAVEHEARQQCFWEITDDEPSKSVDPKSKGCAAIDWAITHLKDKGLENPARNRWRVAD